MLRNLILCALSLALLLHAAESLTRTPLSRATVLRLLDGDDSEDRLYLEGCRQSSVTESCVFATDGDINQESWSNECAMTTADMRPWWEARLENPSFVSKVTIHGLIDINERGLDALMEFELLVGHHVCVRYRSFSNFVNKTFACDAYSDYIRIQSNLEHSVLALCEVAVYGKNVRFERNHEEFANGEWPLTGESCMMSSVFDDKHGFGKRYRCHMAMDNNFATNGGSGLCAHTEKEIAPWWEMKLENPALVRHVVLWNRQDCCQDSLTNFEISIDGRLCIRYDHVSFSNTKLACNRFGTVARVIHTKPKKNILTLCEVQLYGHPIAFVSLSKNQYLGCYKEKKQKRDMEQLAAISRMSKEKCERICRRHKKPFFGLQQGKQCWCSERYGLYGLASEDACWMNCDKNVFQTCGAKLHNSIYEIHQYTAGED